MDRRHSRGHHGYRGSGNGGGGGGGGNFQPSYGHAPYPPSSGPPHSSFGRGQNQSYRSGQRPHSQHGGGRRHSQPPHGSYGDRHAQNSASHSGPPRQQGHPHQSSSFSRHRPYSHDDKPSHHHHSSRQHQPTNSSNHQTSSASSHYSRGPRRNALPLSMTQHDRQYQQQQQQQQQQQEQKQQEQDQQEEQHSQNSGPIVTVRSEKPFIIKVLMDGVPLDKGGIPKKTLASDSFDAVQPLRASARTPKRKRRSYMKDLEDTNSEESGEELSMNSPIPTKNKRIKRSQTLDLQPNSPTIPKKTGGTQTRPSNNDGLDGSNLKKKRNIDDEDDFLDTDTDQPKPINGEGAVSGDGTVLDPNHVDAPPPGVLASLWYSRECVLHIFVIEKILGWKTRPVVSLIPANADEQQEDKDDEALWNTKKQTFVDSATATSLSSKVISDNIADPRNRMEISRINAINCPIVLRKAAALERSKSGQAGRSPAFVLSPEKKEEREEVFLIKWRGRSHLHCSWERRRDLEKFDPSNNTARGKIRRYLQGQELVLGKSWKQMLEAGHSSGTSTNQGNGDNNDANENEEKNSFEEEDFFLPSYTEVERLLACDESEMDMKVLQRQRALNLRAEREVLRRRELEEKDKSKKGPDPRDLVDPKDNGEEEEAWDPEDNVRYVVKWKGLQFSDVTWEYWRDIKHDGVDQAEDFWLRQRPPGMDEVSKILSKPLPHVRDFKKLAKSPMFGVKTRKRLVADLGNDGSGTGEEEKEPTIELRLRSYQLEGVNWLLWNWWNCRSCILADEMGLGKTIQSVCFLDQLHRMPATEIRGPFLIVAPLSLVNQWQSESRFWAPDMNVILYHGSADAREFLSKQEFFYTDQFVSKSTAVKLKRQHVTKFHILITTYEVVLKDITVLSKIRWKALIVDEAHRLKNAKSRLFEDLATVPRDFCLLLTGTPLQNSTEELWALLHFSDPATFASKDAFIEKFGQLTDAQQVSDLHSVLKPYLLRRVKEDVEKSLPPKEETILEVALTPIQKTYYKAIYERNTSFLFKGAKPSNAPSLMNIMMELRKCCNHPFLIRGVEERILADAATAAQNEPKSEVVGEDKPQQTKKLNQTELTKLSFEQLVKSSGKMVLLVKLLPKLQSGGHKVLIFSQMVRVLDLLEELLRLKHYRYERLDGSTSASSRSAAVDRFNRKSCQRFIMLLSTRAGGLGLNLTAADTVIIFDSDWNPQNDLQAMARAHRIGQTRAVRVYRLLTAKTYEMHMFHSASMKLGLDRAVLAHQRQQGTTEEDEEAAKKNKSKSERELQAKEIDELLKKGAYDVFRDDDDDEAQKFMETDIDQLLERSSRTVTYGNSASSSMSSGLGSFSKASFVASTGDADGKDVDLDDPDFWEKAVGLDAPTENVGDKNAALILGGTEKRSRKQVQVFDPYAAIAEAEQKKKDKIALKIKQEKEEKERIKKKKKKKKMEEQDEKKRKKMEEAREGSEKAQSSSSKKQQHNETETISAKEKNKIKEGRAKKLKKLERKRAIRRAEREDPMLERIKQAWEISQRNRVTGAALRFGFGRFCKVRHESNLVSLPIHDIEVFLRGYIFQLGLQAAVPLLDGARSADIADVAGMVKMRLKNLLGSVHQHECDWICRAMLSSLKIHAEIEKKKRTLRLPLTLTDPSFVSDLRRGGAIGALRRFSFLARLGDIINHALSCVLSDLGHEELGKRGCATKDLSTLDVDLKSRHVTSEELSHAIGVYLPVVEDMDKTSSQFATLSNYPAPWWNRSCDLALIIGTFSHGLGNYEAMRNDPDLPFAKTMSKFGMMNPGSFDAFVRFDVAVKIAKKTFDDALRRSREKIQAQQHAAAAAAATASKENEAKKPDKGVDNLSRLNDKPTGGKGKDDLDTVTLSRLSKTMVEALATAPSPLLRENTPGHGDRILAHISDPQTSSANKSDIKSFDFASMPDSECLDFRLSLLLAAIEVNFDVNSCSKTKLSCLGQEENQSENGELSDVVMICKRTEARLCESLFDRHTDVTESSPGGYAFRGVLCGTDHRSLNDGPNYSSDAASPDLAALAASSDASRYQRGPGVPVLLSRYAIMALVYADSSHLRVVAEVGKKCKEELANSPPQKTSDSSISGKGHIEESSKPSLIESCINGVKSGSPLSSKYEVPKDFSSNPTLRASLCCSLICNGTPVAENELWKGVHDDVWRAMENAASDAIGDIAQDGFRDPPLGSFSMQRKSFFAMVDISNDVQASVDSDGVLDEKSMSVYVSKVLIPHCLRLCLDDTRFMTKDPTIDAPRQSTCPLPDPCLPVYHHSEKAVRYAAAIVRRARLMRAIRYIIGGGVSANSLLTFLRRSSAQSMDGMPVWWCPWIHDLGLMIHASTYGLFSIIEDRKNEDKMRGIRSIFSVPTIENYIRGIFVDGVADRKPLLPRRFLDTTPLEDINRWVAVQSLQFPTALVIERRLTFICGEMTKTIHEPKRSPQYINLPLFDHGVFPDSQ